MLYTVLCYSGTVFAYGQTGTGKTYTMEGVPTSIELRGVIPNSFAHIFNHINSSENEVEREIIMCAYIVCNKFNSVTFLQQYLVRASYLEIYQVSYMSLCSSTTTTTFP